MQNGRLHINHLFAILLLAVFSIAMIPWSTLHQDEEQQDYCAKEGKACMHKTHVGNERHACQICSVHFIKDYYISGSSYRTWLKNKVIVRNYTLISNSYTTLIRASLRGPPVV